MYMLFIPTSSKLNYFTSLFKGPHSFSYPTPMWIWKNNLTYMSFHMHVIYTKIKFEIDNI